jgi:hypothetical protein
MTFLVARNSKPLGVDAVAVPNLAAALAMVGIEDIALDAPSWLWRDVVELLTDHERAYLDCIL